uniref:SGNH hydrolase-type esterase domain-containing protein n=1 Tax=Fagus sylvatica TaxID=28930 RepID=A0A2N9E3J6_FAGSY
MEYSRNTIFFTIFLIASLLSLPIISVNATPNITALFAFGDSTVDSGNNNNIPTVFRGDHQPYGQDFPGHVSSGRLCNGKLVTDCIVDSLGLKEVLPAYLDPNLKDKDLLTGVTFGSAGSGLDRNTMAVSHALDIHSQLNYFNEALQRIEKTVGATQASEIVKNALFLVSIGTNDMLINFYDVPIRALEYSIDDYQNLLLQQLESLIKNLYGAGARRIVVAGLPPIGCLPTQVTLGRIIPSFYLFEHICVDQQNIDSQLYNDKLQALTSRLQAEYNGTRVLYVDIYNPLMDMIKNPRHYGFEHALEAFFGTGLVEMGPLCNARVPTCSDPSRYILWDSVHATQAAYRVIANLCNQNVLPQLVG